MQFTFKLMDETDARAIQAWRYEEPYNVYNWGADDDNEYYQPKAVMCCHPERSEGSLSLGTEMLRCAQHDKTDFGRYNSLSEMLDRRSPHYAVRDEQGELVGFFAYGSSAQVWESSEPSLYNENNTIAIGLGMRPDLTGKGLGLEFVKAGLDFAREQFGPDFFRLFVLTFNERAIRVYEHAGFQRVGIYFQSSAQGEREFLEMKREERRRIRREHL